MVKIMDVTNEFHFRIKTLYDIEKQLEMALPKMAKAATNEELKEGFLIHLDETKEQIRRLEKIFSILGVPPRKYKSETIRGLVADGEEKMTAVVPDTIRDVMIAGAARDVEHFEMAGYMNAIEEAKSIGLDEVVELLEMTLEEEIATEKILKMAFKKNLKLAADETEEQD